MDRVNMHWFLWKYISIVVITCWHIFDREEPPEDGHVFDKEEPPEDGIIATYEEHEDSVYVSCWSYSDPWVFASLSYDGRLVINRVPRTEKYKIILWFIFA